MCGDRRPQVLQEIGTWGNDMNIGGQFVVVFQFPGKREKVTVIDRLARSSLKQKEYLVIMRHLGTGPYPSEYFDTARKRHVDGCSETQ
jgi:hypothetical protein